MGNSHCLHLHSRADCTVNSSAASGSALSALWGKRGFAIGCCQTWASRKKGREERTRNCLPSQSSASLQYPSSQDFQSAASRMWPVWVGQRLWQAFGPLVFVWLSMLLSRSRPPRNKQLRVLLIISKIWRTSFPHPINFTACLCNPVTLLFNDGPQRLNRIPCLLQFVDLCGFLRNFDRHIRPAPRKKDYNFHVPHGVKVPGSRPSWSICDGILAEER